MGAALNDLAYAVNDTIKDPAKFKALNVLMQEMINNVVMQALNSMLGTERLTALDKLITAKILLKGVKDETFHFSNTELNIEFDVTMDENTPIGNSGWRELLIPVQLGTWEITADIPDTGSATVSVNVASIGTTYTPSYEVVAASALKEFTANGAYTVPDDIEGVIVLACGAGGGGGGGYWGGGSNASSNGGGAGGGGGAASRIPVLLTTERTLTVSLGAAGSAGARNAKGGNGGATTLTGFLNVTLAGGKGGGYWGSAGDESYPAPAGAAGGAGGGAGGKGGSDSGSTKPSAGSKGLLGSGGAAGSTSTSAGAGGGGSIGNGGKGATSSTAKGSAGTKGGGGGGGWASYSEGTGNAGGAGGKGYVAIYKGVIV